MTSTTGLAAAQKIEKAPHPLLPFPGTYIAVDGMSCRGRHRGCLCMYVYVGGVEQPPAYYIYTRVVQMHMY